MTERAFSMGADMGIGLPSVELLETLRWRPEDGYFLLDGHLARLTRSAEALGFRLPDVRGVLREAALTFPQVACRVRLVVPRAGAPRVESAPLAAVALTYPLRVAVARQPVQADDPALRHKTTDRARYVQARADWPGHADVLLWNTRGEITESTIANVVIARDGRRLTPPLDCGVLPGVYREALIARGELEEAVIRLADLQPGASFFLINSVREWMPAMLG